MANGQTIGKLRLPLPLKTQGFGTLPNSFDGADSIVLDHPKPRGQMWGRKILRPYRSCHPRVRSGCLSI